jgi:hypothetical protein
MPVPTILSFSGLADEGQTSREHPMGQDFREGLDFNNTDTSYKIQPRVSNL